MICMHASVNRARANVHWHAALFGWNAGLVMPAEGGVDGLWMCSAEFGVPAGAMQGVRVAWAAQQGRFPENGGGGRGGRAAVTCLQGCCALSEARVRLGGSGHAAHSEHTSAESMAGSLLT